MKRVLVFFIFLFILHVPAYAEEVPLHIVSTEEAPYQYTEEDTIKGVSAEILRAVLKEVGYEGTEIRMYPWARAYKMALEDDNTLILTIKQTQEREKLFHWTCPLFESAFTVYKLKSRDDITIQRFEDINNYRLGLWRDDARHQYFVAKGVTNIDVVSHDKFNIRKLLGGRIDLYVGDPLTLSYQMKQVWGFRDEEFAQLESVYQLENTTGMLYMAFSLNTDESLREQFAAALEKVKASGKFQVIVEKYLR